MKQPKWPYLLLSMLALAHSAAVAADLVAVTEEWPPYNFTSAARPTGIATDLLREMCADAHLSCDIQVMPWARAFGQAKTVPDTLVFTTARTPEREAQFLWIGPILPRVTWVFVKTDRSIHLQTLADLKHYKVGVVRDDAAVEDLLRYLDASSLEYAASEEQNLKKLDAGRMDAVTGTEVGEAWLAKQMGYGKEFLRRELLLSDRGGYYFALNKNSSPLLFEKLQKSFAELQKQNRIEVIVKRYLD